MRVYLDNCCYNRPFDDQTQVKVRMETEAKLLILSMMRTCAEFASCDWFFTVDRGILKKIHNIGSMRVANPVDFVLEGST